MLDLLIWNFSDDVCHQNLIPFFFLFLQAHVDALWSNYSIYEASGLTKTISPTKVTVSVAGLHLSHPLSCNLIKISHTSYSSGGRGLEAAGNRFPLDWTVRNGVYLCAQFILFIIKVLWELMV